MRTHSDARNSERIMKLGARCGLRIGRQSIGRRQLGARGPGPHSLIGAPEGAQRVAPDSLFESPALIRKRVPPEDVTVQPSRRDKNSRGKAAHHELTHALFHGATISIVEGDRHAGAAISRLIDPIERRYIRHCNEHIKMRGEIPLRDEQRTFAGGGRAFRHDAMICENQALSSHAMPRDGGRNRRGERVLQLPFQEVAHVPYSDADTGRTTPTNWALRLTRQADVVLGTKPSAEARALASRAPKVAICPRRATYHPDMSAAIR